jgi:hypothetical protein
MPSDPIKLPPVALVELYQKVLVDPGKPVQPQNDHLSGPAFLGGNQQQVLVLVNQPQAVHINDVELQILLRILGACKLALNDVAIVNMAKAPSWSDIKNLSPVNCLLLGVTAEELGLPVVFPEFHQHQYDHIAFLQAPSLIIIDADPLLKSKLWLCLKAMFNL